MRPLLYISAVLPARSETFVYNELLALRARGALVYAASVNPPERDLGDPTLEALRSEAIPVYGRGPAALIFDALGEVLAHPARSVSTLARALGDLLTGRALPLSRRMKVAWQALAALALARRVRGLGIGHIHAHMAHVPTTIAMYAARQLGVTFSFTGHANDIFRHPTLLEPKLQRAAFVACISHWHQRFYQSLSHVAATKLPIIRCGVEIPQCAPAAARSCPLIVGVGRLVPKKGFDLLITALATLQDLPWECRLAGGGPEEARLRQQIADLGLQRRITLRGALSHGEVRALIAQADVFALPCRVDPEGDRDGIPVVLMEAMAAGVPVISGALPAIEELVRDNDTGLLVCPGDSAALAARLRAMLCDAALRARLGAAGRDSVRQEFSREVNIDRLSTALTACGALTSSASQAVKNDAVLAGT